LVLLPVLVGVHQVSAQNGCAAGFRFVHGGDGGRDGVLQVAALQQDLVTGALQLRHEQGIGSEALQSVCRRGGTTWTGTGRHAELYLEGAVGSFPSDLLQVSFLDRLHQGGLQELWPEGGAANQ